MAINFYTESIKNQEKTIFLAHLVKSNLNYFRERNIGNNIETKNLFGDNSWIGKADQHTLLCTIVTKTIFDENDDVNQLSKSTSNQVKVD